MREHHFITCLGLILDTVLGEKGENKILVYLSLGDLKTCNGSEMHNHVLNLKEDCLKIIIIFYSILVFTDGLHHFKGQVLASIFVWIMYLYDFYNTVHEQYTVKTEVVISSPQPCEFDLWIVIKFEAQIMDMTKTGSTQQIM